MAENAPHPYEILEDGKVDENLTKAIFDSIVEKIEPNEKKLNGRGSFQKFSIYKVPEMLRKLNEGAYTPRCVSIGPLHKDDKRLADMESQKAIYMDSLFRRITQESDDPKTVYHRVLKKCIEAMLQMEADARTCYAVSLEHIPESVFVEMMLVDGCFILEYLYRSLGDYENSDIFDIPLVSVYVRHDLLLLENQIPFSVLQKLFLLTVEAIHHRPDNLRGLSLIGFIIEFFGNMLNSESPITKKDVTGDHILGLLHNCYLPSPKTKYSAPKHDKVGLDRDLEANGENQDMKCNTSCWFSRLCGLKCNTSCSFAKLFGNSSQEGHSILKHTTTELDLAGVNFYAAKKEKVMDVKFSMSCWFSCLCGDKSPSKIPTFCTFDPTTSCCLSSWLCNIFGRTRFSITPICIYDSTEPFLRNLIAFEQCSPRIGYHVTSYAFLMDTLIDNEKDVELLEKARVLKNCLGANEDASKLFNNICREIIMDDDLFSFKKQWNQVDQYCNSYWPKHIASLRHKYFSNPWAFISFIAVLYAFGLSIFSLYNTIRNY